MKIKTAIAMLLVAIFALSSIATVTIKPAKASAGALTLSNSEMTSAFTLEPWNSGSLTSMELSGPGVEFDLAGLSGSGTGVGNNYPINQLAGGASYYGHYSDFTGYAEYSMMFDNIGSSTIQVSLFMNTGFTNSGPWGTRDWRYDTFWCSNYITITPGQSAIVSLDFAKSYQAWNIADDPVYTGHTDPSYNVAIFRLNEVTNMGFQVLGSGSASVIASSISTKLYINPPETDKTYSDSFFDVYVTLEDFSNFAGFDIKLTGWDTSLIALDSVDYTTSLTALWGTMGTKWSMVFERLSASSYELAAAALATSASIPGDSSLFKMHFEILKSSNFPLSTPIPFALVELSDNAQPIPNPIPATATDGLYTMGGIKPDLEFKVQKWNQKTSTWDAVSLSPYEFECDNTFRVEVYVSSISVNSPMTDYSVTVNFDPTLVAFKDDLSESGIFGFGTVTPGSGVVTVSGAGAGWSGYETLLFALTFHVEFAATANHIWKYGNANFMTFTISIADATLSFASGNIGIGGIATPSPLTIQINFIRGDVDCNGAVNMADIGLMLYYYGDLSTAKPEYDLNNDGIINIYDIVTMATNYGYPI